MYQQKPKSRVFAPLAETYRKLGMYDEAFKILKKGIKIHPNYTLGYIVLANCYHDNDQNELAYNVLRPHVANNLENISLQKLFSKICENLGYLEEALQTYKYLLLLNPTDRLVANKVKELEADLFCGSEIDESPDVVYKSNGNNFSEDDDWVQVSFGTSVVESQKVEKASKNIDPDELDNWSMSDSTQSSDNVIEKFKSEIKSEYAKVEELPLDDEYFFEEYDNDHDDVIEDNNSHVEKTPIITHTLVDLFLQQGHNDRAIEILKNILELHPDDEVTKLKLESLTNENQKYNIVNLDEGHDELLEIIDRNKKKESEKLEQLENKLHHFLNMLKQTADDKCGREL